MPSQKKDVIPNRAEIPVRDLLFLACVGQTLLSSPLTLKILPAQLS
jgi:hypothetical protein